MTYKIDKRENHYTGNNEYWLQGLGHTTFVLEESEALDLENQLKKVRLSGSYTMPHFQGDINNLKKWLTWIIDDLSEDDIRHFFKIQEFMQDQGLSYLSLRYRFRQVIDDAERDLIRAKDIYHAEYDPDLTNRFTEVILCKVCGIKNRWDRCFTCRYCLYKEKLLEAY